MQIEIIQNCFEPSPKKTPNLFQKGQIVTVSDEDGKALIEKGYAAAFGKKAEEKPAKKKK